MSLIKEIKDVVQARRIVVSGFAGSGKTTLSVSASQFAGDTLPVKTPVACSDVVVLNGDSEGYLGAKDCGLNPLVVDMTTCDTWGEYSKQLALALKEIEASKDIKFVVVDAALPAKLIVDSILPTQISDWSKVAAAGLIFYKSFGILRGKTVILNTQVKSAIAAVESDVAKAASESKTVGGERSTFTLDLPKGIATPWTENASLMLAREVKKVRDLKNKDSLPTREFKTHTSANSRLETKSRMASRLAATVDGSWTLNKILTIAYGENI